MLHNDTDQPLHSSANRQIHSATKLNKKCITILVFSRYICNCDVTYLISFVLYTLRPLLKDTSQLSFDGV